MFGFSKKDKSESSAKSKRFLGRLRGGLSRTRASMTEGVARVLLGKKTIDADLLEAIEEQLLLADVGVAATDSLIAALTDRLKRKALQDPTALIDALRDECQSLLIPCQQPLIIPQQQKPFVILMVGVNGAGKTTTIGKLAQALQAQKKSVMLAAGDTFRAAAIEQLQAWGDQHNVPVIAQKAGSDSAAVIYDALQSATAKNIDVLIADTAGRLHTQDHLMEELKKVKRVMTKVDSTAPHEVLLVLDAGIGQNAVAQAEVFNHALGITGLTLTKLDGTAKGGMIFTIAKQLELPIRYIGVGEAADDLREFNAAEFVSALFAEDSAE